MAVGRPSIPLDEHRDFITTSIQMIGLTQDEVREELSKSHGLKVGRSTLVKHLMKWGLRTRRQKFSDSPTLRMRLQHFFHQTRLTDAEISETLTQNEGIDITPKRVGKCRKEMGLYKRVDADKKDAAELTIEGLLKKELEDNVAVKELGQKELYTHLRAKYNITGRDRIFRIAKKLDPEGPERRSRAQRRCARRSGLRKAREAKEAEEVQRQQEQDHRVEEQYEEQDVEQQQMEQQVVPQYVPLDPAMYYGDYPAQTQRHETSANEISRDAHQSAHDHDLEISHSHQHAPLDDPGAQLQGYNAASQSETNGSAIRHANAELSGHSGQLPTS